MTISEAFSNYKTYAYRLETYPVYKVSGEWEDFIHYQKTNEIRKNDDLEHFINDIKIMIGLGRRHIRTRILPEVANEYLKFETEIGYKPQNQIGVEFNFIKKEKFVEMNNPFQLSDFWLFDDELLYLMQYTKEGEFLKVEQNFDKKMIESAVAIKNSSIENAKTFTYLLDKYLKS